MDLVDNPTWSALLDTYPPRWVRVLGPPDGSAARCWLGPRRRWTGSWRWSPYRQVCRWTRKWHGRTFDPTRCRSPWAGRSALSTCGPSPWSWRTPRSRWPRSLRTCGQHVTWNNKALRTRLPTLFICYSKYANIQRNRSIKQNTWWWLTFFNTPKRCTLFNIQMYDKPIL